MDPYPRPDRPADARGLAPRKTTRVAPRGEDADARGLVLRKKTRSALLGVEADARGLAPRKKPAPTHAADAEDLPGKTAPGS